MRRRSPARYRAALPQRAIVAFADPRQTLLERFRAGRDPLALQLPAHVTLVFPFASGLSDLQVIAHMRRAVRRWPVLPITLAGVGAYRAEWVHVRVTRGAPAVIELHDRLYRGAVAPFLRREFTYEPHVTIGRAADAAACVAMRAAAEAALAANPLAAVLRELALVRITARGAVHAVAAVPLGA